MFAEEAGSSIRTLVFLSGGTVWEPMFPHETRLRSDVLISPIRFLVGGAGFRGYVPKSYAEHALLIYLDRSANTPSRIGVYPDDTEDITKEGIYITGICGLIFFRYHGPI